MKSNKIDGFWKFIIIFLLLVFFLFFLLNRVVGGSDETDSLNETTYDNDTFFDNSYYTSETENDSDVDQTPVVVDNLLECPEFSSDENSSEMVDEISHAAKYYSDVLTDSEAKTIVRKIRKSYPDYYSDNKKMETFMWYGYLLEYSDFETYYELGTDLSQAIKYVYRNIESATDTSTIENLRQIKESLSTVK